MTAETSDWIDGLDAEAIKKFRIRYLLHIVDLNVIIEREKHKEHPCRRRITTLINLRDSARKIRNALVIKSGQKQWELELGEYYA
ncbi:MAG: hypothetical protein IT292_01170 [Deltaproteobacteria bacterium]|nr:hypothetical protein [Deltaproteobacteria bacterium]